MTLILHAKGQFTAPNLPILKRDSSLGVGGLASFSVHDLWSFPAQAAIANGATSGLNNMADNGINNALVYGQAGAFSAPNAGLQFNAATDRIEFPLLEKTADVQGLFIFWLKHNTLLNGSGIASFADSATSSVFDIFHIDIGGIISTGIGGLNTAGQGGLMHFEPIPVATVAQVAISIEGSAGNWTAKAFVNGVLKKTAAALATYPAPASAVNIGVGSVHHAGVWDGQFYRHTFDDLSVEAPEAIVARDFTAFDGQFV